MNDKMLGTTMAQYKLQLKDIYLDSVCRCFLLFILLSSKLCVVETLYV